MHNLLSDSSVAGTGLHATRYCNATRHGKQADKKEFTESFSFSLATPPMLEGLTAEKARKYLTDINTTAGHELRIKRGASPCLGMDNVLAQNPFTSPKAPARGPRFKFMSFCKERKKALQEKYKLFVSAYHECCQSLIIYFESAPCLRGATTDEFEKKISRYIEHAPTIIWPSGCYLPTRHKPVVEY